MPLLPVVSASLFSVSVWYVADLHWLLAVFVASCRVCIVCASATAVVYEFVFCIAFCEYP